MAGDGGNPSRQAEHEDWSMLAAALNARMAERRLGQHQLARLSSVSIATIRVLQKGAGGRRFRDTTLAALSRALAWPDDHLLDVLHGTATTQEQPCGPGRESSSRGRPGTRCPPCDQADRSPAATPPAEAIGASREHSQLAAISAVMTAANQ
ncbi:hypothetical protein I7412_33480, partial [Frankia sp. CN6]